jgi:translocation and assembly module TamB
VPVTERETHAAKRAGGPRLRFVFRLLAIILLAVLSSLVLTLALLQNDALATRLVNAVAGRYSPWPAARLAARHVSLHGLAGIAVHDARVVNSDGRIMVAIDTLDLHVSPLPLLFRHVNVSNLRIAGASVILRQQPDSTWDLLAPFLQPDTAPRQPGGLRFRIDSAAVVRARAEAHFLARRDSVLRVEGLTLRLSGFSAPQPVAFSLDTLDAQIHPPTRPSPAWLSARMRLQRGRLSTDGVRLVSDSSDVTVNGDLLLPGAGSGEVSDVDFRLAAKPLDFRDIGAFVPGFDVAGSLRLDARITGDAATLTLIADGRSFDGATLHLAGDITPDTKGPVRYALTATLQDLDASLWSAGRAPAHHIDADLHVALSGASLKTVTGSVRANVTGALIAGGELQPSRISADFENGVARVDFAGGLAPWIDFSGSGQASPFLDTPAYAIDLTVSQRTALPDSGAWQVHDGVVRVRASGRGISAAAMEGRGTITAHAMLADLPLEQAIVDATWKAGEGAARLRAPLAGGLVQGSATASWQDQRLRWRVPALRGTDLDLARVLGDTVQGRLAFTLTAGADRPGVAAINAQVTAQLSRLLVRGLAIDSAAAALTLAQGRVHADARAASDAGRLTLRANGRPFERSPVWNVERLGVQGVDLAQVRTGLPASNLNGTLAFELRGQRPLSAEAAGTLTLDSSSVADVDLGPGDMRLELHGGTLRAAGSLHLLSGDADIVAEAQPFDTVPAFRVGRGDFRDIDLAGLTADRLQSDLDGTLVMNGTLRRDALPDVAGSLQLRAARVNRARLESGQATFALAGGRASLTADLRTVEGGANVDARGVLQKAGEAWDVTEARASVVAHVPDIAALLGQDSTAAALDANLQLEGRGSDVETMEWSALVAASGAWDEARLDTLRLDARIAGGVLSVDTFVVASNVVRGTGGGALPLTERAAPSSDSVFLHLVADTMDATARLLGVRPLSLRGARLDAVGRNDEGAVRLSGALNVGGFIAGMLAADSVAITATATLEGLAVLAGEAELDTRDLAWRTVELEQLTGSAAYDTTGLSFAGDMHKDDGHTLALTGRAFARERRLLLASFGFNFGAETWTLADSARISWGDRITVADFAVASGTHRITLDGVIDRAGTQDLTLQLDSVPVRRFVEFAGVEGVNGIVDGSLRIDGPARAVGVRADLTANLENVRASIRTEPQPGRLGIDATLTESEGQALEVSGSVPFRFSLLPDSSAPAGSETMQLDVRARSFALNWITPFVRPLGIDRLQGVIDGDLHLAGTLAEPRASGSAQLAAGRISIPRQGVDYRGLAGTITFEGDRAHINELKADADGAATVTGDIILDPLNNPKLALKVVFDEFHAARNEWVKLGVSGNLTLEGDLEQPRLEGALRLVDTDIYADRVGQNGAVRPIELTAQDYRMLESYFGFRPSLAAAVQRDPLLPWSMNIDLALGTDVWVRKRVRPQMRVQLRGSLDVRKQPGDSINLFGRIEVAPERSYFEQFGKRFAISDGSVTFNGSMMGWTTAIDARYEVPSFQDPSGSEVVITMGVTGGLQDLKLTLGAEPAMETADILSYLATGRPAANAADFGSAIDNETLVGAGASLAFGSVAQLLEQKAGESIGLDVVEIRQDGLNGATLIAGRYVSPRLYVGFQQPLTLRRDDEGIDNHGTRVEIEVAAFRWLLINLQGAQSEFRYFFRTRRAF